MSSSNTVDSPIKLVATFVGYNGVGKTTLWYSIMDIPLPTGNVPSVFLEESGDFLVWKISFTSYSETWSLVHVPVITHENRTPAVQDHTVDVSLSSYFERACVWLKNPYRDVINSLSNVLTPGHIINEGQYRWSYLDPRQKIFCQVPQWWMDIILLYSFYQLD